MIAPLQDAATVVLDPATAEGQVMLAVAAGVLFLIGALLIPVVRALRPRLIGHAEQPRCAFRWVDLAGVLLAFVFGQALAGIVTGTLYPDVEELSDLSATYTLGITALSFLVPCLYIAYVARVQEGGHATLGLIGQAPGRRATYSVIRYLTGLPMFMGLGLVATLIAALLGHEQPSQEVAELIRDNLAQSPVAILLLATVIVPLLEEILFRGFLLELFAGSFGRPAGVIVSSLIFGALHGTAAMLPIFGLAVILALIKLRTRSLGACWLVHGVHNAGTTLLLLNQ